MKEKIGDIFHLRARRTASMPGRRLRPGYGTARRYIQLMPVLYPKNWTGC